MKIPEVGFCTLYGCSTLAGKCPVEYADSSWVDDDGSCWAVDIDKNGIAFTWCYDAPE